MNIKQKFEKSIGDQAIALDGLRFLRNGDEKANEPDLIYTFFGEKVGIEVTTAYINNTHAKNEWRIRRDGWPKDTKSIDLTEGVMEFELDSERKNIEKTINKHLKKYTGCDRYILVVYDNTMFFEIKDLTKIIKCLSNEIIKYFDRAYLLKYHQETATFKIHNLTNGT